MDIRCYRIISYVIKRNVINIHILPNIIHGDVYDDGKNMKGCSR